MSSEEEKLQELNDTIKAGIDRFIELFDVLAKAFVSLNDTVAKFNDQVTEHLSKSVLPEEKTDEMLVHESTGSCPHCNSLQVSLKGDHPNQVYKCNECETLWVNEGGDWFD